MPTITINHLIYTRVEPAFSPTHKNGFQTVYTSAEIKEQVSEIERHIQCFIPTEAHVQEGIPEYQYFWTESNSAVIVQTLPIEADPNVIDSAATGGRRSGHFVSHALVISRDQFARIGNDPFAVITSAEIVGLFTDSVETLLSYIREEAPPKDLVVKRRAHVDEDIPEGWADDLEKLAIIAQTANEITSQRNSLLLLCDNPFLLHSLLSTALYLMDAEHRIACTFNTFVDGCVPSAGAYWAVGARKRASGSGFLTVDVSPDTLDIKQPLKDPKASPYSLWLRQTLKNYNELSVGIPEVYSAQIAAECLVEKCVLPPDEPMSERALTTFREVNLERYQDGLAKGLTEVLGKTISFAIADNLINWVGIRSVVDMGAREVADVNLLAPHIYSWVLENLATIKSWNDLLKFAELARFDPLIALAGAKAPSNIFTGHKASSASTAALDRLANNRNLSQWLMGLRSALDFNDLITPATAATIAIETDLESLNDIAFANLTTALLKIQPKSIDARFSTRVRRVKDVQVLKEITKLVKKTRDINSEFSQAVQERS